MTKSYNTDRYPEADYTPNDMGVPEKRLSYEEMEKIDELKKDWEQGIINEIIWAETQENEKLNDPIYQEALMHGYEA